MDAYVLMSASYHPVILYACLVTPERNVDILGVVHSTLDVRRYLVPAE
jgi:hypothetical protein